MCYHFTLVLPSTDVDGVAELTHITPEKRFVFFTGGAMLAQATTERVLVTELTPHVILTVEQLEEQRDELLDNLELSGREVGAIRSHYKKLIRQAQREVAI